MLNICCVLSRCWINFHGNWSNSSKCRIDNKTQYTHGFSQLISIGQTNEQTIEIQKSFLTSLSWSTLHGTFFVCNSLLRFVSLGRGFQFYGYLFSFFFLLFIPYSFALVVAFEIFTLTQRDGSRAPSINPIAFNSAFIFVTIWHKRIINNSIGLIRNICLCHYLDLSAADIFPLFSRKRKKKTHNSLPFDETNGFDSFRSWFIRISLMFDQK